jgi:hypothetical protein
VTCHGVTLTQAIDILSVFYRYQSFSEDFKHFLQRPLPGAEAGKQPLNEFFSSQSAADML